MKNLILFTIFVAFISADNFDVRNKWNCPYEILTQGCGDCWNFAGTETFSDRMCASGLSKVFFFFFFFFFFLFFFFFFFLTKKLTPPPPSPFHRTLCPQKYPSNVTENNRVTEVFLKHHGIILLRMVHQLVQILVQEDV